MGDTQGRITYANHVFLRIADHTEDEVLGEPHNLIRHPDMPKCVFKLLWDTLESDSEKSDALKLARTRQLELADEFEEKVSSVVESVARAAEELQETAETLSAAAEETTSQANSVSESVTVATERLELITRASDDLSAAARDISTQASSAA